MKKKLIHNRHGNHGSTGMKCVRIASHAVVRVPYAVARNLVLYSNGCSYVPKSVWKEERAK